MAVQIQRRPLTGQVVEALLERIRAGEWPLGHRLPGETTLAAELGVGRSTLREAVRELAGKGVVDSRQGAGVYVTAVDVPEDWDAVLRRTAVASVLEARIAIETEAAALAAQRRTPSDLRALRRALAGRDVDDLDLDAYVDADMAFHRTVVAAAHNELLVELFDSFLPRLRTAMVEMLRLRRGFSRVADRKPHEELVAAIADHRAEAAAAVSRAHLTGLKPGAAS